MPVIPHPLNCFKTDRDLYSFLLACKQAFIKSSQSQIVSIAFSVDAVDPLAVLQTDVKPHQQHFYFEKSGQQQSLLAIDEAIGLELDGHDRFRRSREFVQRMTQQITPVGEVEAPFAGACFFCGFSFFEGGRDSFAAGSVLLPRWQIARSGQTSTVVVNLVVDHRFEPETQTELIWKQLQRFRSAKLHIDRPVCDPIHRIREVSSAQQYRQAVTQALGAIGQQKLRKIVLARAVDVIAEAPFQLVASLHNLRRLYPDCYIFSSNNRQGQTFVGASPERLVTLRNHRLETDALAGSAPRGQTAAEDACLANQLLSCEKETHEHQLVIDFITHQLRGLGLQPQASTSRLLQLPNIQHLHTPMMAEVPSTVHLLDIVGQLHPTPAVAGVAREVACEYIQRLEPFARSRYAGPIGWVDAQGNGEFAVGIRSAILSGNQARLFAGAGIVAGSSPDKELAEVQLKLQALLRALA